MTVNRTLMELKETQFNLEDVAAGAVNRTLMELKEYNAVIHAKRAIC